MITEKWMFNYNLAKRYLKENGSLLIPHNYFVTENDQIYNLGSWISYQRMQYKKNKLLKKQIDLLNEINMIWDAKKYIAEKKQTEWFEYYELVKKYYEENGDLLIDENYVIKHDGKNFYLAKWLSKQRKKYKDGKLTQEKKQLLEKLKMVWNGSNSIEETRKSRWDTYYELAKEYFEVHKDLLVRLDYVVVKSGKEYNLGNWIYTQRKNYKENTLNKKYKDMLNEIEMVWDVWEFKKNEKEFEIYYDFLKEYYKEHKDLLIPFNYIRVKRSKEYKVGEWLAKKREAYKNEDWVQLPKKQKRLLDELHMVWDIPLYISTRNYINEQYSYYEQGLLDDTVINQLLKENVFKYSDGHSLQKTSVYDLYRKNTKK